MKNGLGKSIVNTCVVLYPNMLVQYINLNINQALRMLYDSLINSQAQYGIIAWGRAASCQLQPVLVVLDRGIRRSNTNKLVTSNTTTFIKRRKLSS